MNNQFLSNALEHYDTISNISKNYYLIMSNDNKQKFSDKFILQSKINNINKYEIEIIGTYIIDQKIWIWGWLNNDTKIFNIVEWCYKSFDATTNLYNSCIKSLIMNSKFIISDIVQLDILLSLACYLYKSNLILNYHHQNNIIYFFSIKYI
jgi:hypothetical protein